MQQLQENLEVRLKGKKIPPKYWEFPELEKGNIQNHCAYCIDINCHRTLNIGEPGMDDACGLINCRFGCEAIYHACKSAEHNLVCPKYEEKDAYEWMYRGMQGMAACQDPATFKGRQKGKKHLEKAKKPEPKRSIGDLFFGPGEPATQLTYHKVDGKRVPNPPDLPGATNISNSSMRLDLRLETETRLQTKPKSMYTFVCAQQFRRDEYHWHSKNVHDDILGGMNNWLEQRCPMASYGCGYSMRRMYPKLDEENEPRSTIVFSPGVESFGISSLPNIPMLQTQVKKKGPKLQANSKKSMTQKTSPIHIFDLPYEILYQIIQHLESFR